VSPVLDASASSAGDGVTWPPPYVPFDGGAGSREAGVVATADASASNASTSIAGPAATSVWVDAGPAHDATSAAQPDSGDAVLLDAASCALDRCVGHCPGTTPCCMPSGGCACMGLFGCGLPPL
jgi:hypothetical protein